MTVLQQVSLFLKQRMGLDASSIGDSAIERVLRQRLQANSLNQEHDYWLLLQQSSVEQQALIEAVVVPETSFFRYPESFSAMADLALKRYNMTHQPLRFLSAPCATGEEPYSIAMALFDVGMTAEQFHIDAIDISAPLLTKAETAIYGKNSFRAASAIQRQRYFTELKDSYQLNINVKQQVKFRLVNLLNPQILLLEPAYDFVFCRNVLIYFDVPTQEMVLTNLIRLLHKEGYLFVGPAEANLVSRQGLQALGIPLSFAFQQAVTSKKTLVEPKRAAVAKPRMVQPPMRASVKSEPSLVPKKPTQTTVPLSAPMSTQQVLDNIGHLANAGRLVEAIQLCQQQLKQQSPSADIFYWLGLLHDTQGLQTQAIDFYRKALYLEPQHTETLAHLSMLLAARGDVAGAQRLQQRMTKGVTKHG
ncbi:CheR family methyltransferase [Agitococcus lubricus]|uniref:Chemotaxis protein methyltransferase WspC n=1 Tax=Agitococcus lubricus TaxID=1077255 RepID=A0A2T5IVH4_9GAMM|nr:protein-glutamate O-methyltransferase CheR [Agitococcus lubricus]PTQ87878.1 chemotaxis protein methyltransferase WspC [Agitococcus lubricus]